MKKIKFLKILKSGWFGLSLLISLWLLIIGVLGNYIIELLDYVIRHINASHPLKLVIIICIFFIILLIVTYIIYGKKKKFKFYALSHEEDAEPGKFKALILPVSTFKDSMEIEFDPDIKILEKIGESNPKTLRETVKGITLYFDKDKKDSYKIYSKDFLDNSVYDPVKKLNEILENLKKSRTPWSWAVPLTIIVHNKKDYQYHKKGRLEHVRLVGTSGDNGSFKQLGKLKIIINTFFKDIEIKCEEISDFEKFDELTNLFEKIAENIEEKFHYKDEEIAIDITGGQKIISIVGTFFTLKSRTPILYLSQKEGGKIKEINAIINIEPPE